MGAFYRQFGGNDTITRFARGLLVVDKWFLGGLEAIHKALGFGAGGGGYCVQGGSKSNCKKLQKIRKITEKNLRCRNLTSRSLKEQHFT